MSGRVIIECDKDKVHSGNGYHFSKSGDSLANNASVCFLIKNIP